MVPFFTRLGAMLINLYCFLPLALNKTFEKLDFGSLPVLLSGLRVHGCSKARSHSHATFTILSISMFV